MAGETASKVEVVFTFVRRIVVFGLGCWAIVNALMHPDERVSQLLIGMVMVGVLPIENIFVWRRGPDRATRGDPGPAGGR